MAEDFNGIGVVWGVKGITMTGVVVNDSTGRMQSLRATRASEKAYVQNQAGGNAGRVDFNFGHRVDITVVPSDTSQVVATQAGLESLTPDPGTVVTIVNANGTDKFARKYLVNEATQNRTNNNFVTVDMSLEAWDDMTLAGG